jgi:hypothetical protein
VFLDIDGVFNNATFGSMDATSGEHRVVLILRKWIDAMLRLRVEIRGSSVEVLVNRGYPQEEVLSPLLWSMVVDVLLRSLMMWFCCKKASS